MKNQNEQKPREFSFLKTDDGEAILGFTAFVSSLSPGESIALREVLPPNADRQAQIKQESNKYYFNNDSENEDPFSIGANWADANPVQAISSTDLISEKYRLLERVRKLETELKQIRSSDSEEGKFARLKVAHKNLMKENKEIFRLMEKFEKELADLRGKGVLPNELCEYP